MGTDDIIQEVGGFSYFQMLLLLLVRGNGFVVPFGMLLMSFAGTAPDWWCVPNEANTETEDSYKSNLTLKWCPDENNITCRYVYSQDKNTIVNEWNLLCSNSKQAAIITSVQMAGSLVGAVSAGQSGDMIGRKPTYYLALLLFAVLNLTAAFSVSWQMFTVLRFFIGFTSSCLIVVSYTYCIEFLGKKWRPVCSSVPFWMIGTSLMALSCWLRPDWSHQHIITAAVTVPLLFGWFFSPESFRWMAVKGRLDEAENIVDKMARYNKRAKPSKTREVLEGVYEEEQKRKESAKKYTYLDLYKSWTIAWKTITLQVIWLCMSMVYYGLAFGVGKLSGNLYLNIFLMGVVELPGYIGTYFLANSIGRRWTCALCFGAAAVGSFAVILTARVAPEDQQGIIINVLALIAKLGVTTGWNGVQIIVNETYPTVIRNLGYGAANASARIGGIIAPYVFAVEGDDLTIPFSIVGSTMALNTVLSLILRETIGLPLADSDQSTEQLKEEEEEKEVVSVKL